MDDPTEWQRGFAAGFTAGFTAGIEQSQGAFEHEEIMMATTELATRFGVTAGQLARVYRSHDGSIVGAVGA